ncbi:MAG TPA: lysylphosphatidylglycerol synthase transmembrane domain-containing protein [Gemmatimonadaceae bacterium]|nr:lysylphosphatidylglycerol synthase transmembrane domain-containing protein [Gemmatimonadaceae bacterium]
MTSRLPATGGAQPRRALPKWLRIVLVAAVIALLALFARKIDWHHAWTSIRGADPRWIAAALVANILSIVLKGIRWWVFLRAIGVDRPLLSQRATLAGAGLNNILVANGGEAARVVFVARAANAPSSAVLATLAIERLFDLVGYAILLAAGTLLLPLPPALARWRWPAVATVVVAFAALAWFARRARGRTDAGAASLASDDAAPPAGGFRARARRATAHFGEAFAASASLGRFAAAVLLSLGAWMLQLATFAWTAHSAGLDLPVAGHLATLLTVNLGFLVRVTPGNVGFFQLAYAVAAVPFGADRDQAIAVSLLIQTLQVIPVTLLGVALAPEFIFRRRQRGH